MASWLHVAQYDSRKSKELIEGFSEGFPLHYEGPCEFSFAKNHVSVSNLESEVDKKVKNELLKGRIEGPFSSSPLNNLKISPLAIIPKRQQNSFRLIHDLSFPRGNSVNSHIPTEFSKVTYETLDHIVALVQKFGKDSLISKVDIEDAFRIMPIHPKDYNLLGFMFREKFITTNVSPWAAVLLVRLSKNSAKLYSGFYIPIWLGTQQTRLHKSRSSRDKLEFDLSNFV